MLSFVSLSFVIITLCNIDMLFVSELCHIIIHIDCILFMECDPVFLPSVM